MKTVVNSIKLVIVCLAVAGLMAGCGPQNVAPAATTEATAMPLPTETPALTPTPSAEEIRTAIITALLTLYTQPNRMDVTTVPSGGQAQSNVIEFIPPDRKHIIGGGTEYIVIGEKVYVKTAENNKWAETQIPASSFLGDKEVSAQTIGETISNAKLVRSDILDGRAVIVYGYSSTTKSGDIELHGQTELWVGATDGLPYKMAIDGETLSASTDPQTGASKLEAVKAQTTTLITFDTNISIEPPE